MPTYQRLSPEPHEYYGLTSRLTELPIASQLDKICGWEYLEIDFLDDFWIGPYAQLAKVVSAQGEGYTPRVIDFGCYVGFQSVLFDNYVGVEPGLMGEPIPHLELPHTKYYQATIAEVLDNLDRFNIDPKTDLAIACYVPAFEETGLIFDTFDNAAIIYPGRPSLLKGIFA